MGKRKIFAKTDLNSRHVAHSFEIGSSIPLATEIIPPRNTIVKFERNAISLRNFNFSPWYGKNIDSITYACQRQVERFLEGQDKILSTATVASCCQSGLRFFLDFCVLYAIASARDLTLSDLNRNLIDGYLNHLSARPNGSTARTYYTLSKSVLITLGQRGIFPLVTSGDDATFPRNPFPNTNRKVNGETSLSKRERQEFTAALRTAIKPIWNDDVPVTSDLLASALLIIALHTGRNATPLLEMRRDCLRPHPKEDTVFLVLWKRRGHNSSKVALRVRPGVERVLESMPAVRTSAERLIRRVMFLTESLDPEAPDDLKGRVWLYRSRARDSVNQVTALEKSVLHKAIKHLVDEYALKDSNGKPLRINISRLRKTFANRVFELTDGDLMSTAVALGSTPRVTDQNYLAPGENARRNWQFMGEILVEELLTSTIGATYKNTPLGRCADPVYGQFAPKREGATCMNFMNCLRCKHYAITADDLHKMFSFYFRVLKERSRMNKHRWAREYSHIPRLIDNYIVAEGLRRGTFKSSTVDEARERARAKPHPFWSVDLIDSLESFS